jgi:hypothetical protein
MTRILTALLLAALSFTASAQVWQARYGVAETFNFKLYNADGTLDVDEADGGTEVSVSCNEGAETTATNDFVDEGTFYSIALTSGEMNCERIAVVIAATTTEVFFIQTNSNASAMTPANDVNLVNIAGSVVSTSTAQLGVNVVNAAGTAWGSGAITAASIATDAIGAAEIAADAIAASEIAADAIGASELATGAITTAEFAAGAIDAAAIATDAIGAAELATGAITTAEFASGAINAAAVAADAIGASEVAADVSTELLTGLANLAVNVAQISTDSSAADALELAFDGTATGARLFGIDRLGTAQSATGTTLVVDSGAAYGDNTLVGATAVACGSTQGYCQSLPVESNVGSTDTLTLAGTWPVTPSGTISYYLFETAPSTGGSGLDAAGVRAAIGLGSANLDTQLTAIDDYVDTEVAAIKTKTDFLPSATAGATGGLFIAGTNAATTVTTAFTSTFTGNLTGSVGSVTGAVGSVTGNVGGNVTGSVGSLAANSITAAATATDFGTEVANAVWALDATGQQTQGSFGQVLGDSAADTDSVWSLANTNLNATVSSRASQTSVDTVDDFVDTEIGTLTTRLGTPSDLGGGASVAGNLADIEGQTDDIGVAGAGLTATDDAIMTRVGAPVGASISADIAAVESGISWNSAWDAEVESETNDALVAIHLNRLFATDYDPASKPGVATALLNELVESDAGVSRFSANALEQAPTGSGASVDAIADEVETRTIAAVTVVNGLGANSITAAAAAADFTTEVQSGLATASAVSTVSTNIGTPSNLGGGATLAANAADIEGQTDDIGTAGAGLTAADDAVLAAIAALNNLSVAQVRDLVIEDQGGGVSLGCALAVILAYAAGDLATTGTTPTYEDPSGTEARATGTIASTGNRTMTITCPTY